MVVVVVVGRGFGVVIRGSFGMVVILLLIITNWMPMLSLVRYWTSQVCILDPLFLWNFPTTKLGKSRYHLY